MPTYARSETGELRQGEIITDFVHLKVDVATLNTENLEVVQITHSHVIVMSQDCDLTQDYHRRQSGETTSLLASVLFCAVMPADDDFRRDTTSLRASEQWRRFKQNNESRFHFLREVPAADDRQELGLPALAVDFRHYFSVPADEVYALLQPAQRRCRLESPYLEHLSSRFMAHMSRVALPLDHDQPLPEQPPAVLLAAAAGASATRPAAIQANAQPVGEEPAVAVDAPAFGPGEVIPDPAEPVAAAAGADGVGAGPANPLVPDEPVAPAAAAPPRGIGEP